MSSRAGSSTNTPSTQSTRDVSLGELLSLPAVWAIVVANFVNHWGYFIYLNWMPSYFSQALGEHGAGHFLVQAPY